MNQREVSYLLETVAEYDWMIEFGCGGSTKLLTEKFGRSLQLFSVETDRAWVEEVRACLDPSAEVQFLNVDIGPTRQWGHPVDPPTAEVARRYHEKIWSGLPLERPGLCLVDGRFRMAVCLQALLHMAPGSSILFHDFANREHFRAMADFLGVAEYVDSFAKIGVGEDLPAGEFHRKLADCYTVAK